MIRKTLIVLVWLCGLPGFAAAQTCSHGTDELPQERDRRLQALAAVRVINGAETTRRQFLPLDQLADSPAVRAMRGEAGPLGDAARAMRFDRREILPGWRVHFVLGSDSYAVSLQDTRDPCGFTYVSDETGVILQARPIHRQGLRMVPTS